MPSVNWKSVERRLLEAATRKAVAEELQIGPDHPSFRSSLKTMPEPRCPYCGMKVKKCGCGYC